MAGEIYIADKETLDNVKLTLLKNTNQLILDSNIKTKYVTKIFSLNNLENRDILNINNSGYLFGIFIISAQTTASSSYNLYIDDVLIDNTYAYYKDSSNYISGLVINNLLFQYYNGESVYIQSPLGAYKTSLFRSLEENDPGIVITPAPIRFSNSLRIQSYSGGSSVYKIACIYSLD